MKNVIAYIKTNKGTIIKNTLIAGGTIAAITLIAYGKKDVGVLEVLESEAIIDVADAAL